MIKGIKKTTQTIRWAMIGGGSTSQIGYMHRSSAQRDSYFQLVAGVFDINLARNRSFAEKLGIDENRCYDDYKTMFEMEAKRSDGIEAVSIVTPNNTHFEMSKAALEAGLHVICEKPLCFTVEEGNALIGLANKNNKIIGIPYGYAGHQLIQQAKHMVKLDLLGDIRLIHMEFSHGFHNECSEFENESIKWRLNPETSGSSYVLGDLAVHPFFIAQTIVPDLKIKKLMCSKQSFIKTREPLEDNVYVLMEYHNGAMGYLWSSAINCGSMHGLRIRIVGSKASIEWRDEYPNQMTFEIQGKPLQIYERGMPYLTEKALEDDRIGPGHAEGLSDAWSNLYWRFAVAIEAANNNDTKLLSDFWYPNIYSGVEGIRWIENCLHSSNNQSIWVNYQ